MSLAATAQWIMGNFYFLLSDFLYFSYFLEKQMLLLQLGQETDLRNKTKQDNLFSPCNSGQPHLGVASFSLCHH